MQSFRLPRHFISLTLGILVGGCALGGSTFAGQQTESITTFSSPQSYRIYNILAAEMYLRQGEIEQAALHYVAVAQQGDDPEIAQRAAELAISAGDDQLAARALKHWIELSPDSFEARQYRALTNLRAAKYDEAVEDLIKVRDHFEEKEGRGFELMAFLLLEEPQADKAYETFKRYVKQEDKSARAQLTLAALALNADRFEEALKAGKLAQKDGDQQQKEQAARLRSKALLGLERIDDAVQELGPIAEKSENSDLKLDYARMLILANRRNEATPLYKQLYANKPEDVDILYTLGLLYLEQEEFAFAEPLMKKLLDVPDRVDEAHYFLGQIYEGQQRYPDAIEHYQQATSSNFSDQAVTRVASLLVKTENLHKARMWLQEQYEAATSNPRKAVLNRIEGQLLHAEKKYGDAVTAFTQALELGTEEKAEVLYARALSYEKQQDFEAAEGDLRTLLKQRPDNAMVLNALGYMLVVNTKRYEEAHELIAKAIELSPEDPAIMDSMGWVLFRLGKLKQAETWLRKAYDGMKEPEIASHLIEVLLELGKAAKAKSILEEMLEQFPEDEMLMKAKELVS